MPILLLHGQPGRGRDWQRLIAAIGDRGEVVAMDRPGWDGRNPAVGFAGSAAAARDALDAAGWPSATIVGHSYGAAVAAWLAAEDPARVDGLVLVAPAANTASLIAIDRLLAVPALEPIQTAAIITCARLAGRSRTVRRLAAAALGVDRGWLAEIGDWLCEPAVWHSFFVEQRLQLRELGALEHRLGSIRSPTAIVMGTADPAVPRRSAQSLARQIPGSTLTMIEGGRHTLPIEFPWRLAEIVLAHDVAHGAGSHTGAVIRSVRRADSGA